MEISKWILSLFTFLSNQSGANGPEDEENGDESEEEGEENEEEGEEESEEADEEESESEDGDDDSGNNAGKNRSKMIPRERFDQVNAKAKKIERLLELGVLEEDEDGELRLSADAKKEKSGSDDSANKEAGDFYFKETDVDKESWPLVQKINKGFKHYEGLANRMAFVVIQLQSENAILRDYPEFLQKNSPLRKRAMEIMKNDPEFKKKYKGDPESGYWAVKRAADLIDGKSSPVPKKKTKSKFIIGKGDGGKGGVKKPLDFSTMSKEDLDKLEQTEHKRLFAKKQ